MIEKPALDDGSIITSLRDYWGLLVESLDFLPVGNDSSAWVYLARDSYGVYYFIKVRRFPLDEVTLDLPYALWKLGMGEVVAPLPDHTGQLWRGLGQYGVILYPYIDGKSGMEAGLTIPQWTAFGKLLRELHSVTLPPDLLERIPRETFQPKWAGMTRAIQAMLGSRSFDDPYQAALAEFWLAHADEIAFICNRTDQLGSLLRSQPGEMFLCHADIHTANLMVDSTGGLHVVDWDQPVLAPRERDLMFVVSEPRAARRRGKNERAFLKGYGEVDINPLALAYYLYEWCVQELGDFGERVFFMPELGDATRQDSLRGFKQLFDPGDVIDGAYQSESNLPKDQRKIVVQTGMVRLP